MRKILIRCGALPTEEYSYEDIMQKNIIGSNIGNLVYQYSIIRALSLSDTEFVPTRYRYHFSDKEIETFNEEYDCFVIPLADAFRDNFINELNGYTDLVKRLNIPCYVIGVGLKAPLEPVFSFSFDEDVKEFIKAVLEKSSMIGIRGEITAEYLSKLGFIAEKDFTVIGCPSFYLNKEIKIKDKKITPDCVVSYNISREANKETIFYILKEKKKFFESYYIPQDGSDLRIMYAGETRKNCAELFPVKLTDESLREALFFNSVPSWNKFLRGTDFSFGTRFHGNVMGLLAGNKTLHIPFDARTKELTDYHKLPVIKKEDIGKDIFELITKADYKTLQEAQKKNFSHYTDFLDKNNIENIWSKDLPSELDANVARAEPPLVSIMQVKKEEAVRRSSWYADHMRKKVNKAEKDKKSANAKNEEMTAKYEVLEEKLRQEKKRSENLQKEKEELQNQINEMNEKRKFKNLFNRK